MHFTLLCFWIAMFITKYFAARWRLARILNRICMKEIFSLQKGMTQAISRFSRHADANVKVQENGKYFYCGNDAKNALSKIRQFYVVSIEALVVIAILIYSCHGPLWSPNSNGARHTWFGTSEGPAPCPIRSC